MQQAGDRLWSTDLRSLSPVKRLPLQILRLLSVLIRDFSIANLGLWATNLVYTTLLSMVPLLAVSFSVLQALGAHTQIEPLLYQFLAPLGSKGVELADRIIGFVDNINVGVLGSVGLAFLLYTVVSLVSKIEDTFNHIWRIRGPRQLLHRFSNYLSVILVGPVLVFAATGLMTSMMSTRLVQKLSSIEPFGTAFYAAGMIAPYLLIVVAFAFMYLFLPNTRVSWRAALLGAVVGGVLWRLGGWVFAESIANSARYNAVYSSFAVLILFLIWLYVSWLIFLLGAQVAFYVQHPEFIRAQRADHHLSNSFKEKLGLTMMFLISRNYYEGKPAWTLDGFVERFGIPGDVLSELLYLMEQKGLIVETAGDEAGYLPARDPGTITLLELITSVRRAEDLQLHYDERFTELPEAGHLFTQLDQAFATTFGERTLHDWVADEEKMGQTRHQ